VVYINGLHSNGSLLALAPHIRLGWKRMAVADTLAYYDIATKYISLIVETPGANSLRVSTLQLLHSGKLLEQSYAKN
jgi:hypothetical protein